MLQISGFEWVELFWEFTCGASGVLQNYYEQIQKRSNVSFQCQRSHPSPQIRLHNSKMNSPKTTAREAATSHGGDGGHPAALHRAAHVAEGSPVLSRPAASQQDVEPRRPPTYPSGPCRPHMPVGRLRSRRESLLLRKSSQTSAKMANIRKKWPKQPKPALNQPREDNNGPKMG